MHMYIKTAIIIAVQQNIFLSFPALMTWVGVNVRLVWLCTLSPISLTIQGVCREAGGVDHWTQTNGEQVLRGWGPGKVQVGMRGLGLQQDKLL